MIFVKHEDILIPENRFRRVFDQRKLDELRESILRIGLLSPLTVEKQDETWALRAGERRFRVIKELIDKGTPFHCGTEVCSEGRVPVVDWNELTPLQRLEIEVEENILRVDFDWKERSLAIEALHKLRLAINGPMHTATDTAKEIQTKAGAPVSGTAITQVMDSLIINKHLTDPEVAKAKDAKEAMKIIRRNAEHVHQAELAKRFDLSRTSHKLIRGDCIEILPTLQEESFDVVLTDPPYGIDADDFGSQASTGHNYQDSRKQWERIMSIFPEESYRVAKQRAHAYVFCDSRLFARLEVLMCLANWKVFSTPLVWFKGNGMVPFPKHGPRRTYECILYAWKGDRETLVLKNDCIIKIPGVRELRHGAQKPVALYCDLLSRSARPGDTVLDCFGGSGTVLVAANRMKLTATYIENDENQYNIAVGRSTQGDIDDGAEEDDGISIDLEA